MHPIDANRQARICAYSANSEEWTAFVTQITPVIALAARRMCAVWGDFSSSTANDIVQEVFLKLCEDDRRVLREFEDRGNDSFLKLLRVITASVATDAFRRLQAEKRGGRYTNISTDSQEIVEHVSRTTDTDAVERATLLAQLDGLLLKNSGRISARDRSLFWLYYRQGFTAEAISRIPAIGLTSKGVESALNRITRLLRESMVTNKSVDQKTDISNSIPKRKGFPAVIAIDTMKHQ